MFCASVFVVAASCKKENVVGLDEAANLKLVGDDGGFQGRLEIKRDGVWGTICDDDFNDAAARVACFELGLGYVKSHCLKNVSNFYKPNSITLASSELAPNQLL